MAQTVKHLSINAGDLGLIPGSGRFPGEGNGNPLQYSCLGNPVDRGANSPWGHKESDMTERFHVTSRPWQPTPVLLPGKSHEERGLVGYSPWGCKELDTTE